MTTIGINIRVNSTKRGNFFLSTPGPDEHPRSAPFDSRGFSRSARVPLGKRPNRKLILHIELNNEFTCAGLRYTPVVPDAILTARWDLVKQELTLLGV